MQLRGLCMLSLRLYLADQIKVICPCLHRLRPRLQIWRVVVGRADSIALVMRQLQLNVLVRPSLLMQDGRRHSTETMPSHATAIPHSGLGFSTLSSKARTAG